MPNTDWYSGSGKSLFKIYPGRLNFLFSKISVNNLIYFPDPDDALRISLIFLYKYIYIFIFIGIIMLYEYNIYIYIYFLNKFFSWNIFSSLPVACMGSKISKL